MANDRDCESCKHKINGACESWDCEFESKEDVEPKERGQGMSDLISRQAAIDAEDSK